MSFYKEYPNRKDHRKQYYDSRRFDSTCQNHGSCSCCGCQRKYKISKRLPIEDIKPKGGYLLD